MINKKDFFMPAEWHKHTATWLAWPYDKITFPNRVEKVENVFASIIYHLHQNETIELLVLDENMKQKACKLLEAKNVDLNKIKFHIVDYADVWLRDYGPTFLMHKNENKTAWVKWKYNAYGEKFPDLLKDDNVFYQLKDYINAPMFEPGIVMEGGAIEVNGKGTLMTTEECLLNPNRNPNLDKNQTEEFLKNYLGIKKIIWLSKGIVNDHTDGHVDEVARFVNENTIAMAYEDDKNDPNFKILDDNFKILQNATDQDGNPFKLIKLPMPKMNYDDQEKAPVSYTNFYIANNLVLVPQFNHENDSKTINIIQSIFPDRKVIGIDSTDLIYGGGSIHCITQQQP
jgi:agmatine deiminase